MKNNETLSIIIIHYALLQCKTICTNIYHVAYLLPNFSHIKAAFLFLFPLPFELFDSSM